MDKEGEQQQDNLQAELEDTTKWDSTFSFNWKKILDYGVLIVIAYATIMLVMASASWNAIIIASIFWAIFLPIWLKKRAIHRWAETEQPLKDYLLAQRASRRLERENEKFNALDANNARNLTSFELSIWNKLMEELEHMVPKKIRWAKKKKN